MRYVSLTLAAATLAPSALAQLGPLEALYSPTNRLVPELIDVDQDGFLDLVTLDERAGNTLDVSWHRGRDGDPFGPPRLVGSIPGSAGSFGQGASVGGGDLDGDGLLDLVLSSDAGLFVMDGLQGLQFAPARVLDGTGPALVAVLDLDLDGDLDISRSRFTSAGAGDAVIFQNDGSGAFSPLRVPGVHTSYYDALHGDVDLDGDLDLVMGTSPSGRLLYFENVGGLNFLPPTPIPAVPGPPFAALEDADGDGDLDILYANFISLPGGWVENVGGVFTTDHVLLTTTATFSAPRMADVDGDGVGDMVFIQDADVSVWFPGDGVGGFAGSRFIDQSGTVLAPRIADIDGDGALDVLCLRRLPYEVIVFPNVSSLGADSCVANANSTGAPASIRASGSRSVAEDRFVVTVAGAPPGQFAAMLVGQVAQTSTLPGSAGVLCLGAPFAIFRGAGEIRRIAADGTFRFPVDLAAIPAGAGFQSVQAGETWLFQGIFRDPSPAGASNLSPAVAVTFVP